MKKLLSLFLALLLLLSLFGCKPAGNLEAPTKITTVATTEATEEVTQPPTQVVTEPVTEATEETVPEKTQPPQEEEIIDPRPHPADVVRPTESTPAVTEPAATQPDDTPTEVPTTEAPTEPASGLDPNGHYTSRDDVALFIHTYGRLPNNYISKTQGEAQYGSYKNIPSSMNIGGDRFYNREGRLPSGHTYYECDIGTSGGKNRGSRRIVFSTDGMIYYTSDHYESFTRLY